MRMGLEIARYSFWIDVEIVNSEEAPGMRGLDRSVGKADIVPIIRYDRRSLQLVVMSHYSSIDYVAISGRFLKVRRAFSWLSEEADIVAACRVWASTLNGAAPEVMRQRVIARLGDTRVLLEIPVVIEQRARVPTPCCSISDVVQYRIEPCLGEVGVVRTIPIRIE
jgi:hypothetical protein